MTNPSIGGDSADAFDPHSPGDDTGGSSGENQEAVASDVPADVNTDLPQEQDIAEIEATRSQTVYDLTHGSDRATYRDNKMRFTDSSGRLHVTGTQLEAAREEMNADLAQRTTTPEDITPVEEGTTRTEEDRYTELQGIINDLIAQNAELQQRITEIMTRIEGLTDTIQRLQQVQPPVGGTETPAGGTETPAGGTETPAGGTETPAGGTETPAGGTETPAGGPAQQEAEEPQQGANPIPLEQQSGEIGRRIDQLNELYQNGNITDAQKIELIDLIKQREGIDRQINTAETEAQRRRTSKERWVRIGGVAAGIAAGIATGPIGIAGMMIATLGGTLAGRGLKTLEGRLRSQSNAMKYVDRNAMTQDQLDAHDRTQRRKAWWANRLGEASAFVTGGALGFGGTNLLLGLRSGAFMSEIRQTFGIGSQASEAGAGLSGATGEASVGQSGGTASQVYEGSIGTSPQPTPQGSIGGTIAQGGGGEMASSLPNRLSFAEFPQMREGLIARGMDPSNSNYLSIDPTGQGWIAAQRKAAEVLQQAGINLNSKQAGWVIGEVASNSVNYGQAISLDSVQAALSKAASILGN
jgi:hypothetical protein